MKIILFSRPKGFCHSHDDIVEIFAAIERHGFDYVLNEEFADVASAALGRTIPPQKLYADTIGEQPEGSVMVCYGGDGTLLDGVHRLGGCDVPVVGINSGHLGFLSLAQRDEIAEVFDGIAAGTLRFEPRAMLCAEGVFNGGKQGIYALNEVSVQRLGATMIAVETAIDGEYTSTCEGDGVIIATPTGSTAYSLSAGGPIVAPDCGCFLLTPLAPHNFGVRPVVVPDSAEVELTIHTRYGAASLSVDNRSFRISDGTRIKVRRAKEQILLVAQHNISFYQTLHSKMMWDVDIRN